MKNWLSTHRGAITMGSFVSIGIAVAIALAGSISYTTSRVDATNKELAEVKIETAAVTTSEKNHFDEILRRLDSIDKKLEKIK